MREKFLKQRKFPKFLTKEILIYFYLDWMRAHFMQRKLERDKTKGSEESVRLIGHLIHKCDPVPRIGLPGFREIGEVRQDKLREELLRRTEPVVGEGTNAVQQWCAECVRDLLAGHALFALTKRQLTLPKG